MAFRVFGSAKCRVATSDPISASCMHRIYIVQYGEYDYHEILDKMYYVLDLNNDGNESEGEESYAKANCGCRGGT